MVDYCSHSQTHLLPEQRTNLIKVCVFEHSLAGKIFQQLAVCECILRWERRCDSFPVSMARCDTSAALLVGPGHKVIHRPKGLSGRVRLDDCLAITYRLRVDDSIQPVLDPVGRLDS